MITHHLHHRLLVRLIFLWRAGAQLVLWGDNSLGFLWRGWKLDCVRRGSVRVLVRGRGRPIISTRDDEYFLSSSNPLLEENPITTADVNIINTHISYLSISVLGRMYTAFAIRSRVHGGLVSGVENGAWVFNHLLLLSFMIILVLVGIELFTSVFT